MSLAKENIETVKALADTGDSEALCELGARRRAVRSRVAMRKGMGVGIDLAAAGQWYEKAAAQQHKKGQAASQRIRAELMKRIESVDDAARSVRVRANPVEAVESGAAEIAAAAKLLSLSTEEVDREDGKQFFYIAVLVKDGKTPHKTVVAEVDKERGVLTYYAKEGRHKIADWNEQWVFGFEADYLEEILSEKDA